MSAGVNFAGTVVHLAEAAKLLGVSLVMLDSALTFTVHCVILTVVIERVNKNQQNFRIFCAI